MEPAPDTTTLAPAAVAAYAATSDATNDAAALAHVLATAGASLPHNVDDPALEGVRRAYANLTAAQSHGAVYGLTTGVGALRHVTVDSEPDAESAHDPHALRLWLSHAGGLGAELDDGLARATMLVRMYQLMRGGSGVHPRLVWALAEALRRGAVPRLHVYGGIGTGDLTVLAEVGLTLIGELPWRSGSAPTTTVGASDALPFMSSNAMTAALAAIETTTLNGLSIVAERIAALSHLALRGSLQAYDERVLAAKDDTHAAAAALRLRTLLGGTPSARTPARIQDPFGLRSLPQVSGAWREAIGATERIVAAEIAAAAENPLVVEGDVLHHGQFLTQRLANTLDAVRTATVPALSLSVSRISALCDPQLTGLSPFLAAGPAGSSGLMIVEYIANDLLGRARTYATPVTANRTTVSLGLEDHASYATQAAWLSRDLSTVAIELLGCELVTAVRALRLDPTRLADCPARELYDAADSALPDVAPDHVLGPEVQAAAALVRELAVVPREVEPGEVES